MDVLELVFLAGSGLVAVAGGVAHQKHLQSTFFAAFRDDADLVGMAGPLLSVGLQTRPHLPLPTTLVARTRNARSHAQVWECTVHNLRFAERATFNIHPTDALSALKDMLTEKAVVTGASGLDETVRMFGDNHDVIRAVLTSSTRAAILVLFTSLQVMSCVLDAEGRLQVRVVREATSVDEARQVLRSVRDLGLALEAAADNEPVAEPGADGSIRGLISGVSSGSGTPIAS